MKPLAKNRKALESQRHIYKSLRVLLKTKQLQDITVADLCEEDGCSRSTFYRNFDNVVNVLAVMFEWFYNKYLSELKQHENRLLYFFEYWQGHRDLINIISHQNQSIIKNTMMKYEDRKDINPYLFDLKYSMLTSIVSKWSELKSGTPKELELQTRAFLNQKCIDILLNY